MSLSDFTDKPCIRKLHRPYITITFSMKVYIMKKFNELKCYNCLETKIALNGINYSIYRRGIGESIVAQFNIRTRFVGFIII